MVTDDLCAPVEYISGDTDLDSKLDPDEVWVYSCSSIITQLTTNKGVVTAMGGGLSVRDEAEVTVSLAEGKDVYEEEEVQTDTARWTQLGVALHSLIKLSGYPAVYYLGADGLAHAFTNERVFMTWNCNYQELSFISKSFFDQLLFGAEVTFAPGVKMIKRPIDPKVYAIEKGGVIRWVMTEQIARDLYGSDWNKMIIDVQNFDGYTLGKDIASKADYDPLVARQAVRYFSDGMGIDGYIDSEPGPGLVCR
jgi:hypothetical protein